MGLAIRRKHDPDAPRHNITAVKGTGAFRTVAIDELKTRFWPTDMFEPCDPIPVVAVASLLDETPGDAGVAAVLPPEENESQSPSKSPAVPVQED